MIKSFSCYIFTSTPDWRWQANESIFPIEFLLTVSSSPERTRNVNIYAIVFAFESLTSFYYSIGPFIHLSYGPYHNDTAAFLIWHFTIFWNIRMLVRYLFYWWCLDHSFLSAYLNEYRSEENLFEFNQLTDWLWHSITIFGVCVCEHASIVYIGNKAIV